MIFVLKVIKLLFGKSSAAFKIILCLSRAFHEFKEMVEDKLFILTLNTKSNTVYVLLLKYQLTTIFGIQFVLVHQFCQLNFFKRSF